MNYLQILRLLVAAVLTTGIAYPATAESQSISEIRGLSAEIDQPPTAAELSTPTRVVALDTGTPIQNPSRVGPSIAVIHKGESYIFDLGSGAVQNAERARHKYDILSLNPNSIRAVFFDSFAQ